MLRGVVLYRKRRSHLLRTCAALFKKVFEASALLQNNRRRGKKLVASAPGSGDGIGAVEVIENNRHLLSLRPTSPALPFCRHCGDKAIILDAPASAARLAAIVYLQLFLL